MHALISPINLNHMVFVSKFDDETEDEEVVDMSDQDVAADAEDNAETE